MATENSGSSTVSSGSGLDALVQIANLLGGQRSTTTNTANTAAINNLLGQLQSADYSTQLQSILQAVAGQTPGLQSRFANAVGARSSNNSAVAANLNKLVVDATLKAQQQFATQQLQSQATQAQLASALASATRGTTTQAGTNLTRATAGLGALSAADKFMASASGKKLASGAKSAWDSITGSSDVATPITTNAAGLAATETSGLVQPFTTAGTSFGADSLNFGDIGSWFNWDTADTVDTVDTATDLLGMAFADGGLVGRDGRVQLNLTGGRRGSGASYTPREVKRTAAVSPDATASEQAAAAQAADVAANVGNTGATTAETTNSLDASPNASLADQLGIGLGLALGNVPGAIAAFAGKATNTPALAPAVNAMISTNPIVQVVEALKAVMALADVATEDASPLGTAGISVSPQSIANSSIATALGLAVPGPNAIVGPMSVPNPTALNPATVESITAAAQAQAEALNALGLEGLNSSVSDSQAAADAAAAALGEAQANAEASADSADGADGVGGDAGGDGGDGGDGAFKSGGQVKGAGTGTSDSIHARVSDGEYIVPADVVKQLGVSFFDKLRAQFHTPSA